MSTTKTRPQVSYTDGKPGGARFHTHVLENGDVSVCWTADGNQGERLYRLIDGRPRRVSGDGTAFLEELSVIARLF